MKKNQVIQTNEELANAYIRIEGTEIVYLTVAKRIERCSVNLIKFFAKHNSFGELPSKCKLGKKTKTTLVDILSFGEDDALANKKEKKKEVNARMGSVIKFK